MLQAFSDWEARRRFLLPDEEEQRLKRELALTRAKAQNRQAAALAQQEEEKRERQRLHQSGDNANTFARRRASIVEDFISDIAYPPKSLAVLPLSVRAEILGFIPIVDRMYMDDLELLLRVAMLDEVSILAVPVPIGSNPFADSPAATTTATTTTQSGVVTDSSGAACPDYLLSTRTCPQQIDGRRDEENSLGVVAAAPSIHPLAVLQQLERVLKTTYEQQVFGQFVVYATHFGVPVAPLPPPSSTPSQQQSSRKSTVVGSGAPAGVASGGGRVSSFRLANESPRGGPSSGIPTGRSESAAGGGSAVRGAHGFALFQRDWFAAKIRTARQTIRRQRSRFERAMSYVAFREKMLNTTCTELRSTIREDLQTWEDVLSQWRLGAPSSAATVESMDVLFDLALGELKRYQSRVSSVEFLGNPELTLDDVRNLFWEVNLARPAEGTVSGSYLQSITFRQAMTLGLTDIPWVKGYSWEQRAIPGEEAEDAAGDDDGTETVGAGGGGLGGGGRAAAVASSSNAGSFRRFNVNTTTSPVGGSIPGNSPSRPGARSLCSQARSDRVINLLGALGIDDTLKAQMEELEAERVLLEAQAEAQRKRAFVVAVDGMSQRLWISTDMFRPRWEHRFRGCEMCQGTPIIHVGLRKENAAVATDIVLCGACYDDLYSDEGSIPHRMYSWFRVSDLIQSGSCATTVLE